MRKIRKIKMIVWICIISLMAGYLLGIPIKGVAASEPEMIDGYTTYTFSDLGFTEGTLTAGQGPKTWDIESWNKVAFTGKVDFWDTRRTYDPLDPYTMLCFGGSNGLRIYYCDSGRYFKSNALIIDSYFDSSQRTYFAIENTESGFNLYEEIQLTVQFDEVGTDASKQLQVTVEVVSGDKSYTESYTYAAGKTLTKSMQLVVQSGSSMKVESIKEVTDMPEENPYTTYTFSDLGFTEGTLTSGDTKTWNIDSWDKVAFTGKVDFWDTNNTNTTRDPLTMICFGGTSGLRIYYSKNVRYFTAEALIMDFYGSGSDDIRKGFVIEDTEAGFNLYEEIQLTVQFDEVGTDASKQLQVTVEVVSGDKSYTESYTYAAGLSLTKNIQLVVYEGSSLKISSAVLSHKTITKDSISYNLRGHDHQKEQKYLVTGDARVEKNGEQYVVEDCMIGEPGDYVIVTTVYEKACEYTYMQNVSLYILGDINLDGNAGTEADLTALLQLIRNNPYKPEVAAEYAADIDYDGKVGTKDLELMQSVMNGETTLLAVLERYHVPAQTYEYLGGDEVMPIAAFHGPYGTYLTEDVFQSIKASGVNLINFTRYDAGTYLYTDTLKALDLATEYGLGWFVEDFTLNPKIKVLNNNAVDAEAELLSTTQLAKNIGKYAYKDAFLGIHIEDEPTYQGATDNAQPYRFLDYYVDVSKQLNSYANITGFINMVAEDARTVNVYNTSFFGGTYRSQDLYDEYWEKFTDNAGAQVFSSDDYPISSGVDEDVTNCQGYFRTLGKTRNESLEHSTPFWSYVAAGGDFENDSDVPNDWAMPTEAETYWNVNTALAFGAKGITWFPLIQPLHMNGPDNTNPMDRCGLLLSNGEKSTFYTWAQNANKQIAAVDEVLMKAKSTAIVASGGYAQENAKGNVGSGATTSVKTSHGKLSKVTSSNTTYGALVGCFDYRETEAFYVVNYNVEGSDKQTINLTLDGDYDYRCIIDGVETYGTTTEKTISISLAPGTAALIVLEDRTVAYAAENLLEYIDTNGNRIEPDAEPGYVFAGWFSKESCKKEEYIKDFTTYTGTAYAKYVADEVLTVKAQLNAGAKRSDNQISMRFVSSVDSLDYQSIGFYITKTADPTWVRTPSAKAVYTTLTAKYGQNNKTYLASHYFGEMANYFQAYAIWNIPSKAYGVEYEVTPYWVTLDGTTVYGQTTIKTVNQGLVFLEEQEVK